VVHLSANRIQSVISR